MLLCSAGQGVLQRISLLPNVDLKRIHTSCTLTGPIVLFPLTMMTNVRWMFEDPPLILLMCTDGSLQTLISSAKLGHEREEIKPHGLSSRMWPTVLPLRVGTRNGEYHQPKNWKYGGRSDDYKAARTSPTTLFVSKFVFDSDTEVSVLNFGSPC